MNRFLERARAAGGVFGVALTVAFLLPTVARAQIYINEVLADNTSTYMDDEGNFPDMVELYNFSGSAVNLTGWKMSDDPKTNKFTFPAGTTIGAYNFLVVFCDHATNLPGLHSGFALSRKGSYLGITNNAAPAKSDSVIFGLQISDYSIGRIPNGNGAFALNLPTFGNSAAGAVNVGVTLGPTNGLRYNEWAATNTPPTGSTNQGKDWLELYNPSTNPVSLSGLVFTTTVPPTNFPLSTKLQPITNLSFIGPIGFIKFDCVGNGNANANDELNFKLSHNTGETNTLYLSTNRFAPIIDQIGFPGNNTVPGYWVPDCSYGRLPDGNTNGPSHFFAPGQPTPGASNFQPLTNSIVINEVLSHTDLPLEDAIELFNPTASPVDISGWWLSNDRGNRLKFRIPSNTVVAPYGFKVFYEMVGSTNGFNTNGTGVNPCFTFNSAHGDTAVITAVSNYTSGGLTGYEITQPFDSARNGVSFGRYVTSDTNIEFVAMSQLSLGTSVTATSAPGMISVFRTGTGATNPYPQVGALIISEIMYHPPDILQPVFANGVWTTNNIDDSTNEFIEVFNITSTNVPLYDPAPYGTYYDPGYPQYGIYANGATNTWQLHGTVDFIFPTNVTLASSNYLVVVNFSPTNGALSNSFCQKYQVPTGVPLFGPYNHKLSNKGGSIQLQMPDLPQGPQHPDFGYVPYILVERVKYDDAPPWPTNADGRGFSLHRAIPQGYGNDPTNWCESLPSPGQAQRLAVASPKVQGNYFSLNISALAGMSYTLQGKDTIGASTWLNVMSVDAVPTNSLPTLQDGPLPPSRPSRFYRVVSPKQQ